MDLAGSERVARTRLDGTTLREAKHISLSLHYLEQVILALQVGPLFPDRCVVPFCTPEPEEEPLACTVQLPIASTTGRGLQERSRSGGRQHVPYRNSMLTSVLRDSLGGNANTAMTATVSGQEAALPESLATCRFAQRVALVRNQARGSFIPEYLQQ